MRVFAEHGSYVVACRVDHVGDLPDSQARRGQHLTRLGQSVVQHVRHQNGGWQVPTRAKRVFQVPPARKYCWAATAQVPPGTPGSIAPTKVAKPSLAGGTTADENSARADEVSYRLASGQRVDDY